MGERAFITDGQELYSALEDTAREYPGDYFIEAGQSHELFDPRKVKRGQAVLAIVNMDKATGRGTHWTAFAIPKGWGAVYYFDSLGKAPPAALAKKLRTFSRNILFSDTQIQPNKSNKCGFYALDFLERFLNGDDNLYGGKISKRRHAQTMAEIDRELVE